MGHVEALLVRVLAVSKHTARVIRVGLAVLLERLPVCPDNQTYSELVQTSLSGQLRTLALFLLVFREQHLLSGIDRTLV